MSRGRAGRGWIGALLLVGGAVIGVVQFSRPARATPVTAFTHLRAALAVPAPTATATPDAFGRSGEVRMRFALPGQAIEFPLAVSGASEALAYEWASLTDSTYAGAARALVSAESIAPTQPGIYRMVVVHAGVRQAVAEPTLAVMVPFDRKLGQWLNGYLIGDYLAEQVGGRHETPRGFVEVHPGMERMALSTHLTLGDFISHDDQVNVWPKYVAVDPQLLDKLELVITTVGRDMRTTTGRDRNAAMRVSVSSAFRSPAHNRTVQRAARDSRHQYGDAADVQIDANGDGRMDLTDEILVMLAVEQVEDAHPELVGGLGIYTSRRYRAPYLHIDTRGHRKRWTG